MTLQKSKNKFLIILGITIISITVIVLTTENSCGVRHIFILNDLKVHESSLDPEYCEALLERIDSFNLECHPNVEILDCG